MGKYTVISAISAFCGGLVVWASAEWKLDGSRLEIEVRSLQASLLSERARTRALESQLELLMQTLAQQAADSSEHPIERLLSILSTERRGSDGPGPSAAREAAAFSADPEAVRKQILEERFVRAGLSPQQAQHVLQREEELPMEMLLARHSARDRGASMEELEQLTAQDLLREELGDADYEKYRRGRGFATSVTVRNVLRNSQAALAGLRRGDEILAYNGERVFSQSDLIRASNQDIRGDAAELVAVDVIRDGLRMSVYVQPGPFGVVGGGEISFERLNATRLRETSHW